MIKNNREYNEIITEGASREIQYIENKSNLGANSILGVSLAVAKAASNSLGLDLYQYIGGINGKELPIPMMNILNGGKHSDNNISIQEFMIMPVGEITFAERLKRGAEIYHTLRKVLKQKGYSVGVGDEGGFAPNMENEEQALDVIIEAIKKAKEQNIEVVLTSGRMPKAMLAIASEANANNYLICGNGAMIYDVNKDKER